MRTDILPTGLSPVPTGPIPVTTGLRPVAASIAAVPGRPVRADAPPGFANARADLAGPDIFPQPRCPRSPPAAVFAT